VAPFDVGLPRLYAADDVVDVFVSKQPDHAESFPACRANKRAHGPVGSKSYIVRRDDRLVRRRVVDHLHQRLSDFEAELVGQGRHLRRYRFEPQLLDALHASLASYLGHLRKANSYQLRTALWERFTYLRHDLTFAPASGQISRRDRIPRGITSVRNQYAWLRRAYPTDVIFFQVGRFDEFYASADDGQAEALGLRPLAPNRRRARYGFPVERARA
jgi:hypothetical protein